MELLRDRRITITTRLLDAASIADAVGDTEFQRVSPKLFDHPPLHVSANLRRVATFRNVADTYARKVLIAAELSRL